MNVELVSDRFDVADQILLFLNPAIDISGPVNQPGNHLIGAVLGPDLFGAYTGGPNKVGPPVVMRLGLVFLPLVHRRSTDQDNPLGLGRWGGEACRSNTEGQ